MTIRELFGHRARTAFVLGGGGNLGSIQVGQLRALFERGIVPDVVIGCSVGALNGAAIADDPTLDGVGRLDELWRSLAGKDIFPTSNIAQRGPWRFVRNGLSAYGDEGLQALVSWLRIRTFEEAKLPFWVVATSLRQGVERWFNHGDMTRPLLASSALPGVFPPVNIDGEDYIDGGVVNNVPISKAFELKARKVYVLDVGNIERERPTAKRPYEVLMQAVSIARAHRFRMEREQVPDKVELVRLPAPEVGKLRYDDFTRSTELIERAYQASKTFLDQTAASQTA
jgi:NTE family protein